jgi:hypothetical protein
VFYQTKAEITKINALCYVDAWAQRIIKLYDAHASFDECASVPELAKTLQRIQSERNAGRPRHCGSEGSATRPFCFRRRQVLLTSSAAGRKNVDPYGGGGEEWQPIFQAPERLVLSRGRQQPLDELNLWPDPMTVSADLPTRIRQADPYESLSSCS